ncbi:MAG: ATP-binding protein [Fusobacterium sp.]
MKINRDSLLVKIVFYNNIAIIITSLVVAMITTFITYEDMESRLVDMSREKIYIVEKAYNNYITSVKEDINKISREDDFTRLKQNSNNYKILSYILKNELVKENFQKYYKIEIAILNDKGEILGFTGEKKIFDKNIIFSGKRLKGYRAQESYIVKKDKQVYSRILYSYKNNINKRKEYILASIPFELNILQYIKQYIELGSSDKIFAFIGDSYITGDFKETLDKEIINPQNLKTLKENKYKYYYSKKKIGKTPYYMGILSLKDYNNENIGCFGVAISREKLFTTKFIIGLFITIIVITLVTLSTTIFGKMLKKLLLPLKDITESAERISDGNYSTRIKLENTNGEIKTLAVAIKKMLRKLEDNQRTLKQRNIKLKENLRKMNTIEQLILEVQTEEDVTKIVQKVMTAFISELGLGFSRGMFFRYSRERDALIGEKAKINSHILDINNDILKEKKSGFNFQIEELEEIIQLIKIPFSEDNIISDALKDREIKYYNSKGYKHNLGNDLFNSLGLSNFLIFPVYNIDYYTGVMVFDYYIKEKKISEEDMELLKLLLMNISIKFRSKVEEEEKIELERNMTISKVAERFLNNREEALNNLLKILEDTKNRDYKNIAENIKTLEGRVEQMKQINKILIEYSNPLDREKIEKVNIEHLIPEVISEFKLSLPENNKVLISSFISYTGDILGNNKRLRRVFMELLKNAYDAVMENNRVIKKIDIVVIRDKHSNKLKIDIKDNGIGILEEDLDLVFQPFITHKKDAPGLGLSLVKRVIKDCKGVVKIYSKPEIGTTVKITLNILKEEN